MWTKRVRFIISLLAFVFCLFADCVGICSPSRQYTISETDLEMLSNHLIELEKNNETLKAILSESNEDLTIALDALTKSQNELVMLKTQLQQAKADAQSAKQSLATANEELRKASESFKQYEKERDKTENRLRNQRNIWEVLCLVAVGVAAAR